MMIAMIMMPMATIMTMAMMTMMKMMMAMMMMMMPMAPVAGVVDQQPPVILHANSISRSLTPIPSMAPGTLCLLSPPVKELTIIIIAAQRTNCSR